MLFLLLFMFFLCLILFLFFFINFMVCYKNLYNREKLSSFECGFHKFSSSRLPFSIQFFIICLLFLIFDIEITLFIPMILSFDNLDFYYLLLLFNVFMLILILGTILEWLDNSFDWLI